MSLLLNTESDKDEAAILKDSGVNAIGRGIKGSGIYPLIKYPKYWETVFGLQVVLVFGAAELKYGYNVGKWIE